MLPLIILLAYFIRLADNVFGKMAVKLTDANGESLDGLLENKKIKALTNRVFM